VGQADGFALQETMYRAIQRLLWGWATTAQPYGTSLPTTTRVLWPCPSALRRRANPTRRPSTSTSARERAQNDALGPCRAIEPPLRTGV